MARPRRKPPASRQTSAGYQRRNLRAQALGYGNYYDYRIHDNGRRPPGSPISKGQRSRARGHRGKADFLRAIRPGDIILLPDGIAAIAKDSKGRFIRVDKLLLKAKSGTSEMFTIRRQTYDQMVKLIADEAKRGAIWSPSPSLDQRRLVRVADQPDDDYDADDDGERNQ